MGVPCYINSIHSIFPWLECTESLLFQVYRSEGQSVRYKNESDSHWPKSVSVSDDAIPAIFFPATSVLICFSVMIFSVQFTDVIFMFYVFLRLF